MPLLNCQIASHAPSNVSPYAAKASFTRCFGVEGLKAFKKTCDYAKSKGLVIIGDIKRGDIGSTSEAYAIGHHQNQDMDSPLQSLL